MNATDRRHTDRQTDRQTDVRQHHRLMPPVWGTIRSILKNNFYHCDIRASGQQYEFLLLTQKRTSTNSCEIIERMGCLTGNKPFEFVAAPDPDPDPGIFTTTG